MLYGNDPAAHAHGFTAPALPADDGVSFQQKGQAIPSPAPPSFFSTMTGKLVLAAAGAGLLYLLVKKFGGGGAAAAPKS